MSEEAIPEGNGFIQNGEPVPKPNKYGKITYNKDGTPRKNLSQEALEKLAKARQAAKKYHEPNKNKKIEKKIENLKSKLEPQPPTETPPPSPEAVAEPKAPEPEPEALDKIEEEQEEEEQKEVKIIKKATSKKKNKKPVIIVEQDESDDDEFEDKENVIFVKRAGRVKREKDVKEPEPQLPPSTIPAPPPRPQMTAEQIRLSKQYDAMFSGQFLQGRRRF